jgi:hypothetical protein
MDLLPKRVHAVSRLLPCTASRNLIGGIRKCTRVSLLLLSVPTEARQGAKSTLGQDPGDTTATLASKHTPRYELKKSIVCCCWTQRRAPVLDRPAVPGAFVQVYSVLQACPPAIMLSYLFQCYISD